MTTHWVTEDLPAYAWDSDQPPPDNQRLTDLWGQHLTTYEAYTMTTVRLASQEYL